MYRQTLLLCCFLQHATFLCYAFGTITTTINHSRRAIVVVSASSDKDEKPSSDTTIGGSADEQINENQNSVINITTDDDRKNNQQQAVRSKSSSSSSSSSSPPPPSPTAQDLMLAMGTNPRRIALSIFSATGIALAGNFLGVTSRLLTVIPEDKVEATGLDTYFPRGNFKRCQTDEYTYVLPSEWVADTFLALAKAQRKAQPLDYSMDQPQKRSSRATTTLPDSAYGPPGRLNQKGVTQQGDTNVSVIVSSGLSGFTLKGTLGTPKDAAESLLLKSIAPEGSGRTATLLRSIEDRNGENYKFEYIVDFGERRPPLRNIAVIAASPNGETLYTLTVVAPAEKWMDDKYDAKLRKIADSFHLR
ncbi:MAG: hypothetical protein ACI8RD_000958 [Bacillariaceae sp.]|jgi:hypothetical protein